MQAIQAALLSTVAQDGGHAEPLARRINKLYQRRHWSGSLSSDSFTKCQAGDVVSLGFRPAWRQRPWDVVKLEKTIADKEGCGLRVCVARQTPWGTAESAGPDGGLRKTAELCFGLAMR